MEDGRPSGINRIVMPAIMVETVSTIDSAIGRERCKGLALAELAVVFIRLALVREHGLIASRTRVGQLQRARSCSR